MAASTSGSNPPFVLPPIRPNMVLGLPPQGQNTASGFQTNQFQFGGTIPYPPPPQPTNPPNIAPDEPPDDDTTMGTAPEEPESPTDWATNEVEQNGLL